MRPRSAPSARRSVEIWASRLFSSTTRSGQPRRISSSLLSTAPRPSIRVRSVSNARPPSSIGRPSARNSRRRRSSLKRPNSIVARRSDPPSIDGDCTSLRRTVLSQRVEQSLGGDEIGGVEALTEATADGSQQLARLARPALSMPEPGEARGPAQLPRQGPLAARPLERVLEVILGGHGGVRRVLPQYQLAFDAQQIRGDPGPPALLGTPQRLG